MFSSPLAAAYPRKAPARQHHRRKRGTQRPLAPRVNQTQTRWLPTATLQDGLRDIVAPSPTALGRVARAHPVAAVIEQLAGEERVRVLAIAGPALSMLRKQPLDPVPCLLINDRIVKTIVGLTLVCEPPKVDGVRQDLVEMAATDQPAAYGFARPVGP